ncbi:hypothetical protein D9M69_441490 [compost metagenome]
MTDRLKELIAKKKAEAMQGEHPRTRGHATRVLSPRIDQLKEMMVLGLSLKEMVELLAEAGVQVSYHSLRTFLMKHLAQPYREYMAIGSAKAIPDYDPEKEPDPFSASEAAPAQSAAGSSKPAPQAKPKTASKKTEDLSSVLANAASPRKFFDEK